MAQLSKRKKKIDSRISVDKAYDFIEAANLLADLSTVNFSESFDISINLGVDPKKSDQVVRSATVLPYGTGKNVRVAVIAQGDSIKEALEAGADRAGMDDLVSEIKNGELNYDVVISSPDTMRIVGQLGQILGPRGLMPNPKLGTVTRDIASAVKNAKSGQIRYRTDKSGIIHAPIGRIGFEYAHLKENLEALIADLRRIKPASSKGIYIKRVALSTTMGPGLWIDQESLSI